MKTIAFSLLYSLVKVAFDLFLMFYILSLALSPLCAKSEDVECGYMIIVSLLVVASLDNRLDSRLVQNAGLSMYFC